jgi:hypothetical protein
MNKKMNKWIKLKKEEINWKNKKLKKLKKWIKMNKNE